MKHLVRAIQRHYPLIYHACHVEHVRARSTPYRLSTRDAMLLAHLDEDTPVSASELARHWGVAESTMSATLQRIGAQGYIKRTAKPGDRRIVELRLTTRGAEAMAAVSVLEARHVRGMLKQLSPRLRQRAVAGLAALAQGARHYCRKTHSRRLLPVA
jgi:DNA-binding MarR family transcriptional regulator